MIFTVDFLRNGEVLARASGEVILEGDLAPIALEARRELATKHPDLGIFSPGLEQRIRHSLNTTTPELSGLEVKGYCRMHNGNVRCKRGTNPVQFLEMRTVDYIKEGIKPPLNELDPCKN